MAALSKEHLEKMLEIIKIKFPDAQYTKGWTGNFAADIDEACGCYSEWTTDPCELRVYVVSERSYAGAHQDMLFVEIKLHDFAEGNLEWKGCECCSGGEDYDGEKGYLSVDLRITPIQELEKE
jgi:hypothetical protein